MSLHVTNIIIVPINLLFNPFFLTRKTNYQQFARIIIHLYLRRLDKCDLGENKLWRVFKYEQSQFLNDGNTYRY